MDNILRGEEKRKNNKKINKNQKYAKTKKQHKK